MEILPDDKFMETSREIINQLGFKDIKAFIKNQALMMLLAKLDKYESEERFFERKYGMSFEEFQKRVQELKNDENFEEDDDYLDWRFAKEALNDLIKKKQELEYA